MSLLDAHCSVIAVTCVVLSGAQLFLVLTEQLAVCRREMYEGVNELQGRPTIMTAIGMDLWHFLDSDTGLLAMKGLWLAQFGRSRSLNWLYWGSTHETSVIIMPPTPCYINHEPVSRMSVCRAFPGICWHAQMLGILVLGLDAGNAKNWLIILSILLFLPVR
ncbi:unnamed protein product [Triticum turgidum subsp. durum]|uniref:Uncharacterized protein n=1 Tax=Triticum turgidum subsp. durum TaxID=4567 RepID=A0A9R1BA78_TRITD|nr:unnamed protein product [Triticum turgidum subsp. durum]